MEDLNVEDHSNAIIETNDDDIEFEASNSITPTNTVQLNTVTSCATILKKNTNKKIYNAVCKEVNQIIPEQADNIPSYYKEQKNTINLREVYMKMPMNILQMTLLMLIVMITIIMVWTVSKTIKKT